jgi:[methyl-Co(III) methanol-specific corrinoid protein]:coenzyme M methyltransferase
MDNLRVKQMNAYDRVMNILNGNKRAIDRLPAMNSVGTYSLDAMNAFDAKWPEAHRDPKKMARLAAGLSKLAGLDNITVPFDLTLEAEAFGAPVDYFEDQVKWPTVKRFIAKDASDIEFPDDILSAGRIPHILEALRILREANKGEIPVIAYINAPFTSISSYLVEPSEFLKMVKRTPEKIAQFCDEMVPYYAEIANAFVEAGADVITFREEGASLDTISPRHFDELIKPYLTMLIARVKAPRIIHICGQCISGDLELISNILECGAEAITIGETTSMRATKEIADKIRPGCPIGGNISAYNVIHGGPTQFIREHVRKAIDDGADMVTPGCDFWIETPTKNVRAFVEAVEEFGKLEEVE